MPLTFNLIFTLETHNKDALVIAVPELERILFAGCKFFDYEMEFVPCAKEYSGHYIIKPKSSPSS